MGRTCKLHTERNQSAWNPGPSCCEVTELTTEPPCHTTQLPRFYFKQQVCALLIAIGKTKLT
ncbi:hypothetical protein LDENG_00153040 [Lucifuga dentata]|nr:hypothetical protein LDENG_00153040 [Lucifuga dentata]